MLKVDSFKSGSTKGVDATIKVMQQVSDDYCRGYHLEADLYEVRDNIMEKLGYERGEIVMQKPAAAPEKIAVPVVSAAPGKTNKKEEHITANKKQI